MESIQRTLTDIILHNLEPQKVQLVYGARRTGKTILLKQIIEKYQGNVLTLNGEDIDTERVLEKRSIHNYRELFKGYDLLVIDEAQHIADIGLKLKLIVDEIPGIRVIASGSSSFTLKDQSGEPLVGRSYQYLLPPLSEEEIATHSSAFDVIKALDTRLIYGSYPEVVTMTDNNRRAEYLMDIVDAYLLRDILAVDGIKNSDKMRDLLRLIAYQMGSEVSLEELGQQLSMSKNTVERYLDLLQKVFVLYRIGGYAKNLRKEISKASKWYFYDNGIRNAILHDFKPFTLRNESEKGLLWESYIMGERRKLILNHRQHKEMYFWRTYDQQEIDLIEAEGDNISAFEIKSGNKLPSAPLAFAKAYPEASFQVININNYMDYITH